jgi:hypothetical protein
VSAFSDEHRRPDSHPQTQLRVCAWIEWLGEKALFDGLEALVRDVAFARPMAYQVSRRVLEMIFP